MLDATLIEDLELNSRACTTPRLPNIYSRAIRELRQQDRRIKRLERLLHRATGGVLSRLLTDPAEDCF